MSTNNLIQVDFKNTNSLGLELVMIPGRKAVGNESYHYQEAYGLWKDVWSQTLKDLDGLHALPSDQFTRQDLILGLFLQNKCIGLSCFRKADLANPVDRMDSWFTPWMESTMVEMSKKYAFSAANSFFTIHPNFRKSKSAPLDAVPAGGLGVDVSVLMAELVVTTAYHSGADATYGVTRNNRSVNKLAYHGGAVPIAKDQMHHGVSVDLIALIPEHLEPAMRSFLPLTHLLWEQRIRFTEYGFQREQRLQGGQRHEQVA